MAQFTLFCRLPPEIRDEIWQLCLPRRILELDYPSLDKCVSEYASWQNGRPPVLARVCREARRVAQAHGKFNELPLTPSPNHDVSDRFWHQLYLDSVHLNLLAAFESGPFRGKTCFSDAVVRCRNMATPLSFTRRQIKTWDGLTVKSSEIDRIALTAQTGETFRVVFLIIPIHLTTAQVTNSGLFGHLGDEIIKLVDLDAFDVIEKYRRLVCTSKRQPANVQSLFDALAPQSAWRESLPRWQQTVQTLLLSAACKDLAKANQTSDLNTLWVELASGSYLGASYFLEAEPVMDIAFGDIVPNYDNVVVRRLISQFPEFRPAVMFRACTYDLCEEKLDYDSADIYFPLTSPIETIKMWQGYTIPAESN